MLVLIVGATLLLVGARLPFLQAAQPAPAPTKIAVIRANVPDPPGLKSAGRIAAPAPDFEWIAPDGSVHRLTKLRGKSVVINWWATWCGPCRAEMPALERVASGMPDVVFLELDLQEDQDQVAAFMERLGRGAHVRSRHSAALPAKKRSHAHPQPQVRQDEGKEDVVAPSDSLARLRKRVLDRVARGEVTVLRACREAGISRSRYYQLRRRYLRYGEAGLRPRPQPARAGRRLARLAAAEALSAAEGGPLTERTLREIRAIERPKILHIGSEQVGAELFADTMYVGKLKEFEAHVLR